MSLEAMVWAVKDAPSRDPFEHSVLTVMADEAGEDGCNVWLSVATIAERARMSEREARDCVRALLERKLIGYGDQSVIPDKVRRDRRPVVYDLLIPAGYYSNLARVNKNRGEKGRGPLTAKACEGLSCADRPAIARGTRCGHRPDIAPPPPKKRRSDLGKPRPRKDQANGGTVTPPAEAPLNGGTDSPGGLANAHGGTDRSPRGDYQSPNPLALDPEELTLSLGGDQATTVGASAEPPEREIPQEPKNEDQAVDALVEEALAAHPTWPMRLTRKAIRDELEDRRPLDVVTVAWRACINHPQTTTPNRFKHPGPWWDVAYGQAGPRPPSPRAAAVAECRRCDPSGWLLDVLPAQRCDHSVVVAA